MARRNTYSAFTGGYGTPIRRKRRLSGEGLIFGLFGAAMLLVILGGIIGTIFWYNTENTVDCTVNDKTATSVEGATDYRIYTDECGVLQVGDALFAGQFDAADRYNEIKVGESYTFETIGWRLPLFSAFPNIVEVR